MKNQRSMMGTESTLKNKATWRSLRNQGEGQPEGEAGRKGDKQGKGYREGRVKPYGDQARIENKFVESNISVHIEQTDTTGQVCSQYAVSFRT